ncbi:MAG TPA: DinB family protein [Gemmatimonadaceae bacterium]|nr:DinB family protein [Gemmatimonadaceae bacterium]
MDQRLEPMLAQFELNVRLLLNCVADLDDSQMTRHPVSELNSAAFLVAHLIDTRHYMLGILGRQAENPVARYVADARSMADVRELPPKVALLAAWQDVAALLRVALADVDDATLAKATQQLPGSDGTVLGALYFLLVHEGYHIGQLSFIRRIYGLPGMKYS